MNEKRRILCLLLISLLIGCGDSTTISFSSIREGTFQGNLSVINERAANPRCDGVRAIVNNDFLSVSVESESADDDTFTINLIGNLESETSGGVTFTIPKGATTSNVPSTSLEVLTPDQSFSCTGSRNAILHGRSDDTLNAVSEVALDCTDAQGAFTCTYSQEADLPRYPAIL